MLIITKPFITFQIHKNVVRGRSHLNVSAIIKKVPTEATVRVVVLRHSSNMTKIAVKKFTQFPVKLDDVVSFLLTKVFGQRKI